MGFVGVVEGIIIQAPRQHAGHVFFFGGGEDDGIEPGLLGFRAGGLVHLLTQRSGNAEDWIARSAEAKFAQEQRTWTAQAPLVRNGLAHARGAEGEQQRLGRVFMVLHHVGQAGFAQYIGSPGEPDGGEMIGVQLPDEREGGFEIGACAFISFGRVIRLVHQIPQEHAAIVAMRADQIRKRTLPVRGGIGPGQPLRVEFQAEDNTDVAGPGGGKQRFDLRLIGGGPLPWRWTGLIQPNMLPGRLRRSSGYFLPWEWLCVQSRFGNRRSVVGGGSGWCSRVAGVVEIILFWQDRKSVV